MEKSKKMVARKPQKRSVEYLLDNASNESIRRLIDSEGILGNLKPPEMKQLLGVGVKSKLPQANEYTAE